jgi:site-specific DNA-methyltransferase (adenine-specific)
MNWNGLELPPAYYSDDAVYIIHADCRDILPLIPDKSIDLVLTDPPYGITSNKWDTPLSPQELWKLIKPVAKSYVLTAGQPYSSFLVAYQFELFKHEWIWVKNRGSNFANTVREPMKEHEHILFFSEGKWVYNPQMQPRNGSGGNRIKYGVAFRTNSPNYREFEDKEARILPELRVPSSVQYFNTQVGLHPTQKPEGLFRYLLLTYSETGQTIIDPFMGSGTTAIAAKYLNRKFVGIEVEEQYCEIAAKRLDQSQSVMKLEEMK